MLQKKPEALTSEALSMENGQWPKVGTGRVLSVSMETLR